MRILVRVAIFFYVLIISIVGLAAMLFLAHFVALDAYEKFIAYLYKDPRAGTIAGFIVASTMIISFALARLIYGRQAQERIITFDNPLGRVTISISALEDLVRRLVVRTPQIKEIRPEISATKQGLKVNVRLILRSDANISELTASLQELIKGRIQDVIGKEEKVLVRVHVIKISSDNIHSGKKGPEDDSIDPPLHFYGYRA